jgi:tetratricopeptide (TPR) repeat protein
MSFIQELRRRKVVRTTLAYLAAAFVAAQVTQLLVDGLGLGPWVLKTLLIVELVALPLVIGLAWAFDLTPDGVERTGDEPAKTKLALPWRRIALPVAASTMLLLVVLAFLTLDEPATLDTNLVAIVPFHVSGDPELAYLREGMVDLLAAKLTGEGGPRAADPRAVLSLATKSGATELDDAAATEIARHIGAGQVLIGSVVGTPQQFTIHAKLKRVPGGRVIAEAEEVATANTLMPAIDKLTAKLLSLQAGVSIQSLDALTTTSLPALRAYLEAQREYRSSHFAKAMKLYERAVELDTTFALAAIGHTLSAGWGEGGATNLERSARIARKYKDRLGPIDRALATALLGEEGKPRSYAERFAERDALVNMAPDRADAWMLYADLVTHWGNVADRDGQALSKPMFDRILKIDSSFTPALLHLIDIAIDREQVAELRRLEPLRKARDPDETAALYQRSWRIRALGDSAGLAAERAALDTMSADRLFGISFSAGISSGTVDDAVGALERLRNNAVTSAERAEHLSNAVIIYDMVGMPSRTARAYDELMALRPDVLSYRSFQILTALYGHGDREQAQAAVRELDANLTGSLVERTRARCATEQWRLWNGDDSQYQKTARLLSTVPADSGAANAEAVVCVQVLATINAIENQPAALKERALALNALMRDGPAMSATFRNAANIVLMRAAERAGDRPLAYRAISRTPFHPIGWVLLPTMIREQGRLAALSGDRDKAIALYRRYLNFSERAEPAVQKEVDAVRAHLAQLTGERR